MPKFFLCHLLVLFLFSFWQVVYYPRSSHQFGGGNRPCEVIADDRRRCLAARGTPHCSHYLQARQVLFWKAYISLSHGSPSIASSQKVLKTFGPGALSIAISCPHVFRVSFHAAFPTDTGAKESNSSIKYILILTLRVARISAISLAWQL